MPKLAAKKPLTDRFLKSLKPAEPGKRPIYWDSVVPAFCVRLTDRGGKSFYVGKRPADSPQLVWTRIGEYGAMSLADAREAARAVLATLAEGKNPLAERKAARAAEKEAKRRQLASSFTNVAELYIQRKLLATATVNGTKVPILRSGEIAARLVRRELTPRLGNRPVREITRAEIIALVNQISANRVERAGGGRSASGGQVAAREALVRLGAMFSWMVGNDYVEVNPCTTIRTKDILAPLEPRDRVLSDDELPHVWAAAEAEGYPHGPLLQILLLTGQRLREWAEASWGEIDLAKAVIDIPKERMKAKQPHQIPLTPRVVELLEAIQQHRASDDGGYVFSYGGGRPPNNFAKLKARLDARISERAGAPLKPWVLHDLRRTCRTGLSEAGVSPFVGELILAHTQKDIRANYDKYDYRNEKRSALEAWEKRLLAIVGPPEGGNVVPFRKTG